MKNEHEDPGSFGETNDKHGIRQILPETPVYWDTACQSLGRLSPHHPGRSLVTVASFCLRTPSEPPADAGFAVNKTPPADRKLGRAHGP